MRLPSAHLSTRPAKGSRPCVLPQANIHPRLDTEELLETFAAVILHREAQLLASSLVTWQVRTMQARQALV